MIIAQSPERPIERGIAGPGLLAKTIVYRWQDHLPAYRQSSTHALEFAATSGSLGVGHRYVQPDLLVIDALPIQRHARASFGHSTTTSVPISVSASTTARLWSSPSIR